MKSPNYSYTNNGLFPIRYIKKTKFISQLEDVETPNGKIIENHKKNKSLENLNIGFKTKGVSKMTMKKIAIACRILSYASKEVTVRNSKGEYIKHLNLFISLTLPSTQEHEDTFITKKILGNFLDTCRKLGFLNNYVWRAEKQKNGNIHYHILTDSFVNYNFIRRIWYRVLSKYGYMKKYHDKFSSMCYEDYKNQSFNNNRPESKINQAFARGKRNNWSEPPCVDVEAINSIGALSKYLSKYVSKNSNHSENIVKGRVWSCSKSVSESIKEFKGNQEFNSFWYNYSFQVLKKKVLEFDFFSVVLCEYKSIISWSKDTERYVLEFLSKLFKPCQYYLNSLGIKYY